MFLGLVVGGLQLILFSGGSNVPPLFRSPMPVPITIREDRTTN